MGLILALASAGCASAVTAPSAATPSGIDSGASRQSSAADKSASVVMLAAKLGPNASLNGLRLFPSNNAWNKRVNKAKVDKNSKKLIKAMSGKLHADFGADWDGGPFGIPYIVVGGSQKKVPVKFTAYPDQSDPGPYPIPANAPIEGGAKSTGDRHVLVLDRDRQVLYELYDATKVAGGKSWRAASGAVFNLKSNRLRPAGWTSADAAGLPILPGLVRYDEVASGKITHAIRFTMSKTRKAYVAPARHYASSSRSSKLPVMGMRVRLKKKFKISSYPKQARVILQAMKTYGLILADNGSNWFVSGTPDKRWNDSALNSLKKVPGSAFEVVKMGKITKG